jgi:two-component system KDP operon response regulator KdpE
MPRRATILIIDDSRELRAMLREAFALEGYRVLEGGDGRKGVRLCREAHPDLVLLDIIMPEKDGIETLRDILEIAPGALVITLSGKPGAGEHNRAAQILGAVPTLQKPFPVGEVQRLVRRLLNQDVLVSG